MERAKLGPFAGGSDLPVGCIARSRIGLGCSPSAFRKRAHFGNEGPDLAGLDMDWRSETMSRITIIGASGGVGRRLVELALERGHDVTAAARNPAKVIMNHERLKILSCDVLDPRTIGPVVAGQDAVLCALGSPDRGPTTLYSIGIQTVALQMQSHHVRRLVILSNFGVLNEPAQGPLQWLLLVMARRVLRHTLVDHRRAIAAIRLSGLEWTVVRPLVMTNGPRTGTYRVALDHLPPRGIQISRGDVADFMLGQIADNRCVYSIPSIAY